MHERMNFYKRIFTQPSYSFVQLAFCAIGIAFVFGRDNIRSALTAFVLFAVLACAIVVITEIELRFRR